MAAALFSEPPLDTMPLPDPLCLLKPLNLPGPVGQTSIRNLFNKCSSTRNIFTDLARQKSYANSQNVSAVTNLSVRQSQVSNACLGNVALLVRFPSAAVEPG